MRANPSNVAFWAIFIFAGCTHPARREAASLAEAMDRFRKADNGRKPSMLETLRAAVCTNEDVCQAKETCLASASSTSRALVLKDEVERALAQVESGKLPTDSPEAADLSTKLEASTAELQKGFALLGACDDALMALRRRYSF